MRQTPVHDGFNPDLLPLIPKDASRVIEVGCGGGGLAREYLKINSGCDWVGIEIDAAYADFARVHCSRVITGSIEHLGKDAFESLFPSSCWSFGDVLEHLYDPWAVLTRIRQSLHPDAQILACIPNAQHWSIQARLNCGEFDYADAGLMDRTHIRWFTRKTILNLFQSCGFRVIGGRPRVLDEPMRDTAMAGIRALAEAIGTDVEVAINDATAFQWVVQATPA
jgi:SAM-dependent methyltransferase